MDLLIAWLIPRQGLAGPWRLDWMDDYAYAYGLRNAVACAFWALVYLVLEALGVVLWSAFVFLIACAHALMLGVLISVMMDQR